MSSVRKRTWTAPDGTRKSAWAVNYVDHAGKRRQKTFERKREAEAARHAIEVELRAGTHLSDAESATVLAVADLYLKNMETKLKDGRIQAATFRSVRQIVEKSVMPGLGMKVLNRLTFLDVEHWHRGLMATGISARTARARVNVLCDIESFGRRRRLTTQRIVSDVLTELRGIPKPKVRNYAVAEVQKLLATVDTRQPYGDRRMHATLRCIVYIAASVGLRYGEIAGLTPAHIDLDRRVIAVRQALDFRGVVKEPKTKAGIRDVAIPIRLAEMLREYIGWFGRTRSQLLFRTNTEKPIPNGYFHSFWRPLLRRAGLEVEGEPEHFHFHGLRHFAGSWMIAGGMTLPDVSRILGHANVGITLSIYAHSFVQPDRQHHAFDAMEAKLLRPAAATEGETLDTGIAEPAGTSTLLPLHIATQTAMLQISTPKPLKEVDI